MPRCGAAIIDFFGWHHCTRETGHEWLHMDDIQPDRPFVWGDLIQEYAFDKKDKRIDRSK